MSDKVIGTKRAIKPGDFYLVSDFRPSICIRTSDTQAYEVFNNRTNNSRFQRHDGPHLMTEGRCYNQTEFLDYLEQVFKDKSAEAPVEMQLKDVKPGGWWGRPNKTDWVFLKTGKDDVNSIWLLEPSNSTILPGKEISPYLPTEKVVLLTPLQALRRLRPVKQTESIVEAKSDGLVTYQQLQIGDLYELASGGSIWMKVNDTKCMWISEVDNVLTDASNEKRYKRTLDDLLNMLHIKYGDGPTEPLSPFQQVNTMANGQWFTTNHNITKTSIIYVKLENLSLQILGGVPECRGQMSRLGGIMAIPITRAQYLRAVRPSTISESDKTTPMTVPSSTPIENNYLMISNLKPGSIFRFNTDSDSTYRKVTQHKDGRTHYLTNNRHDSINSALTVTVLKQAVEFELKPTSRLFYFQSDKGVKRIYQEDNGIYHMVWRDGAPSYNYLGCKGHKLADFQKVTYIEHGDFIKYKEGQLTGAALYGKTNKKVGSPTEPASPVTQSDKLTFGLLRVGELYTVCGLDSGLLWLKTSDHSSVFLSTADHHFPMSHTVNGCDSSNPVWRVSKDYFLKSLEELHKCPKLPAGPLSSFKIGDVLHGESYCKNNYFVKIDDNKFMGVYDNGTGKFNHGFVVEANKVTALFYPVHRLADETAPAKKEEVVVKSESVKPAQSSKPQLTFDHLKIGELFDQYNQQGLIYLKIGDGCALPLKFCNSWGNSKPIPADRFGGNVYRTSKERFQKELDFLGKHDKQPAAHLSQFKIGDILQGSPSIYYIKTADDRFHRIFSYGGFTHDSHSMQLCSLTLPFCLAGRHDGRTDTTTPSKTEVAAKPPKPKWAIFRILG